MKEMFPVKEGNSRQFIKADNADKVYEWAEQQGYTNVEVYEWPKEQSPNFNGIPAFHKTI